LTTPAALWRAAVDSDPSRPFVTSYDEAGGRVELSFATIDNWISKTANLLVEEFLVEPGDRVALAAPVHWQSLAWLYACWVAGATPVLCAVSADTGLLDLDSAGELAGERPGALVAVHLFG
jgi:uncharacterized protein (TIGR03089 family)